MVMKSSVLLPEALPLPALLKLANEAGATFRLAGSQLRVTAPRDACVLFVLLRHLMGLVGCKAVEIAVGQRLPHATETGPSSALSPSGMSSAAITRETIVISMASEN